MQDTETLFHCDHCGLDKPKKAEGGTGYANTPFGLACYECCAAIDREEMRHNGKIVLYLSTDKQESFVTNWPGTLRFKVYPTESRHNIGRTRSDVWFKFDGSVWHGVQIGQWNQVCRCKRTKRS